MYNCVSIMLYMLQIKWEKYQQSITLGVYNILIVGLCFAFATWPIVKWRGGIKCNEDFPTIPQAIFHFFFYLTLLEIFFYYIHRLAQHDITHSQCLVIINYYQTVSQPVSVHQISQTSSRVDSTYKCLISPLPLGRTFFL